MDEMKSVFRELGANVLPASGLRDSDCVDSQVSESEMEKMIQAADANNDGVVDFGE